MTDFNRYRAASAKFSPTGNAKRGNRLPPYSRQLDPDQSKTSLIVLTGSEAWARARPPSIWFKGQLVLLPFGDDPTGYRWPSAGRDCVVFGFGEAEPRERLVSLSVELIQAGALFVFWSGQWLDLPHETRKVAGALSEEPSVLFRPNRARGAA